MKARLVFYIILTCSILLPLTETPILSAEAAYRIVIKKDESSAPKKIYVFRDKNGHICLSYSPPPPPPEEVASSALVQSSSKPGRKVAKNNYSLLSVGERATAWVTGYYKPLPPCQQNRYFDNRTYKEEQRVNGCGVSTAREIFWNGQWTRKPIPFFTAAADPAYPDGTKFRIKSLGKKKTTDLVVIVQDKGSDIVGPDRFDVFCGEGEAGLNGALRITGRYEVIRLN